MSYQNEFEAKYIVGLCAHLLRLGYSPSQITILTPYVGQLMMIRNKMPKSEFNGVHVTAIDNFQGEENDIILFSMVRSTNPKSSRTTIGFLKEDNRVCVSLSRAKHGFYAIGNFELIRHQSRLWESIISDVESRECYGNSLPLYCCNHPEIKYSAQTGSDFEARAPNGGCRKMCDIRLPCGHSCTQICHVVDTEHAEFKCKKICDKPCSYNHPCKSGHYCYRNCPPCRESVERVIPDCGHTQIMECWVKDHKCQEIVTKTMPRCGHEQDIPCSTKPSLVLCRAPCPRKCINEHPCQKSCSEYCGQCLVEMEKVVPSCDHKQMIPCNMQPECFKCKAPCPKLCPNGHPCPKECSKPCGKCKLRIPKAVSTCGHMQYMKCYQEPDPANCRGECEKLCPNGEHKLRKLCSEDWPECRERVIKTLPECGHAVEAQCIADPSTILCVKPCERSCEAGHKCLKLCHEKCAPCPSKVKKTLLCGHTHVMTCGQASKNSFKCPTKCLKPICERGHICKSTCHSPKTCGVCKEMVTIQLSTCSHKQTLKCFSSTDPASYGHTCQHPCEKKLQCGHVCQKKCGEPCQKICTENVVLDLICGHRARVQCHKKSQDTVMVNCKERVSVRIDCGHTTQTECYKAKYKSLLRKACNKECKKTLSCGHACQKPCGNMCTRECMKLVRRRRRSCGHVLECECYLAHTVDHSPCTKKCQKRLPCGHPCQNACGEPCSMCTLKSLHRYPCGHSAKIPCNSSIEENPCKRKCTTVLSCGHNCSGNCGHCYSSRMHAVCIFEIRLQRYCGNSVTLPCAGLADYCDRNTHTIPCVHTRDHSNCQQLCSWNCKHFQCQKQCTEECDRPPCNEPCDKELRCGHRCPGLCGERCMSVCPQCEKRKFIRQLHPTARLGHIPANQPFFELDCGHIFTVGYLDECMEHSN
ncbi:NFX1-type zinc finger-containing protein 1, partial [Geodia barretti]